MADPVPSPPSGGASPSQPGRRHSEPASEFPSRPDSPGVAFVRQAGWALLALILYYAGSFFFQNFTASGNFEQGLALEKARKCSEAIVKLDRALSFDPQMAAAYEERAICHWR